MQGSDRGQDSGKNYGSYQATVGDVKDSTVVMGHRNVVGENNTVAYEGAAAAGPGGAAATGESAAATGESAAATGESAADRRTIVRQCEVL